MRSVAYEPDKFADKITEFMPEAPLPIVFALMECYRIRPRTCPWVGRDRAQVTAYPMSGDKADDEIIRIVLAAGFHADGAATLLSGHWCWPGHTDARSSIVEQFVITRIGPLAPHPVVIAAETGVKWEDYVLSRKRIEALERENADMRERLTAVMGARGARR